MSKIKKLFYSVFVAFISIGVNSDIEARVTKEVAEATLPYLMEAAGIPGDPDEAGAVSAKEMKYKNVKIKAILDMIYTDEGQQQMVNWVKNGEFPNILKGTVDAPIFRSENTYADEAYRKVSLASLFPCQTGTFTSFANHPSRLGLHILSNDLHKPEYITSFLQQREITERGIGNINFQNFEEANTSFHGKRKKGPPSGPLTIDALLAKVIFVLDIVDDKNILTRALTRCEIEPPMLEDIENSSEYTVRPLSAIVAMDITNRLEGDCIETLYRHLINIAIQEYGTNKFHIERLPAELRKYYANTDRYFDDFKDKLEEAPGLVLFESEAGITNIGKHKYWKECLQNMLITLFQTKIGSDFYNEIICSPEMSNFCISIGSITYIANILHEIAFFDTHDLNLDKNTRGDEKNRLLIQNAMNKLANAPGRFVIRIEMKDESDPEWVDKIIEINDSMGTRRIRVAFQVNGHAEITKIEMPKP